jgi:hypothetical protein
VRCGEVVVGAPFIASGRRGGGQAGEGGGRRPLKSADASMCRL